MTAEFDPAFECGCSEQIETVLPLDALVQHLVEPSLFEAL